MLTWRIIHLAHWEKTGKAHSLRRCVLDDVEWAKAQILATMARLRRCWEAANRIAVDAVSFWQELQNFWPSFGQGNRLAVNPLPSWSSHETSRFLGPFLHRALGVCYHEASFEGLRRRPPYSTWLNLAQFRASRSLSALALCCVRSSVSWFLYIDADYQINLT